MIKHIKVWIYIDKNQRRPCYFIICFPFSSSFQSLAYLGFLSFCKNTAAVVLQKARDLEKLYELVSDNQFSCTGAFKLSPIIFPMFQGSWIELDQEIWSTEIKISYLSIIFKESIRLRRWVCAPCKVVFAKHNTLHSTWHLGLVSQFFFTFLWDRYMLEGI